MRWVKAHAGHTMNKIADELAKAGAKTISTNMITRKTPLASFKVEVKEELLNLWTERWQSLKECRQTKIWYPVPRINAKNNLFILDRFQLGRAIQFITGHNYLNYHLHRLNPQIDPTCRLCHEGTGGIQF